MKNETVFVVAILLLSSGSWAQKEAEANLTIQDIASGSWGFDVEGASCEDNPHTIEFPPDGKTMILRYAASLDDNPPTEATYKILGEGEGFMRMENQAEQQTDEAGDPVQWDLVLLTPDSYCWHRTDWQAGGCTQPATRCVERGNESEDSSEPVKDAT